MAAFVQRLTRALDWLLSTPVGLVLIVAGFLGAGLWAIYTGGSLNDEGLGLAMSSSVFRLAPLDTLYYLRSRPLSSAMYALPSTFGNDVFFAAHLLVAATALPLLSSIARALGLKLIHLPALLTATCVVFLNCADSGNSQSDGLFGVVFFAWLWIAQRRWFWAGAVLGLLPLLRAELGLLTLIVGTYMLIKDRRIAFFVGLIALPSIYTVGGMFYHHDILWFLHYPPHPRAGGWGPGGVEVQVEARAISLQAVVRELVMFSPMLPIALAGALRAHPGRARVLAVFALLLFLILHVFPFLLKYFPAVAALNGLGARYFVVILPFLALMLAQLCEDAQHDRRAQIWLGASASLAAILPYMMDNELLPDTVAWFVLSLLGLAVASMAKKSLIVGLVTQLAIFSAFALAHLSDGWHTRMETDHVVRWLADHNLPRKDKLVYTNLKLLVPTLAHRQAPETAHVRFVFQDDIRMVLVSLTNPTNGQRDAILKAIRSDGTTLFSSDLDAKQIAVGSIFALQGDERLWKSFDRDLWMRRLKLVARVDNVDVFEVQ